VCEFKANGFLNYQNATEVYQAQDGVWTLMASKLVIVKAKLISTNNGLRA
jgi:hypothetical protein